MKNLTFAKIEKIKKACADHTIHVCEEDINGLYFEALIKKNWLSVWYSVNDCCFIISDEKGNTLSSEESHIDTIMWLLKNK